jgi:photosystem II stability/assembly factor-like uncharacterized protein
MQPAIVNGGRAVSVSRHPFNDNNVIVASESGGLFRSTNGGINWSQVSGSTTFWFNDVKYYTANPNIIIATANPDWKVSNGGGIWRSTDGGASWAHMTLPPAAEGCSGDLTASCIDVEPGANRIWVGTSCGLVFSNDGGATWAFLSAVSGYNHESVIAILAPTMNNIKILTNDGVRVSTDGGANWTISNTGMPSRWYKDVHNGMACSPFNDHHIFLACNFLDIHDKWHHGLFLSSNNGLSWSNVIDEIDNPNRPPFVKIANNLAGISNSFDVYFSDGRCTFERATYINGTTPSITGSWVSLNMDHCDGSDLTFKADRKTPFILTSDGGLSNTSDNGVNWHLYAGGVSGYNALQMTEGTGQLHSNGGGSDLYFSTQDNSTWASPDNGNTWPSNYCCEGFYMRIPRNSLPAAQSKLTGVSCAGCGNYISGPLLTGVSVFPNPPNDAGNPCLLSPGNYIQNTAISGLTASIFALTTNNGGSWITRYGFPEDVRDLSKIAGEEDNPVIFTAVRRGSTPDGQEIVGIKKIVGVLDVGTPVVSDISGFGSLGIFPTMFAWYKPFGIDLHDPNHLIVPDIINSVVKVTFDGGASWHDDSILTNLVTQSGVFRFKTGPFCQITNISFDPDIPGRILVGTYQAGIFSSCNDGVSWNKLGGTEIIPEVSSFYFMGNNKVLVTSYGRGMWKLALDKCPSSVIPIDFVDQTKYMVKEPIIYYMGAWIPISKIDPEVCPKCGFFLVNDGDIRSYVMSEKTKEITQVLLSSGKITGYSAVDGSEIELPFQIGFSEKERDFRNDPKLKEIMNKNFMIKGLYLEGNIFKGLILSKFDVTKNQLPQKSAIKPNIYVRFRRDSIDKIEITGSAFENQNDLMITLDGKAIQLTEKPKFDDKGNFILTIKLPLTIGEHTIVVEQETSKGKIKEASSFVVPVSDIDLDKK